MKILSIGQLLLFFFYKEDDVLRLTLPGFFRRSVAGALVSFGTTATGTLGSLLSLARKLRAPGGGAKIFWDAVGETLNFLLVEEDC